MTQATEKQVKMASQLYQCRDAARTLLGDNYRRDMELWATAIKGVAEVDKCSELAAATKMAAEGGPFGAITILAAFVEMTEPSVANGSLT
jgi:hypothetical protein